MHSVKTFQIEISEGLYKRLGSLARPFIDKTPESVIEWLVGIGEGQAAGKVTSFTSDLSENDGGSREFDPWHPPGLFHTQVQGEFAGTRFSKWNDLLRIALEKAFERVGSFGELQKVTHAQIRDGNHTGSGYRYVPSIRISYQGVDANYAWQHAFGLARFLKVPIKVRVEWRHKDGAAYPGESGVITWIPSKSIDLYDGL